MENKVIIANGRLIKISKQEDDYLIGYDVCTEALVKLTKSKYTEVSEDILILLNLNEEQKLRLANSICKNQESVAKYLNVSYRTLVRLENKYLSYGTMINERFRRVNLSDNQIEDIRKLSESGEMNQVQLAVRYNTSTTTIRHITRREKSYK